MDLIESLDRTFRHAHTVIASVRPDQYDASTPCEEWTVHDLLTHMIGVVAGIGAATTGAPKGEFQLADDPAAQFAAASQAALAGWRTPGAFDGIVDGVAAGPMPGLVLANINLLDTATHSWDLATATGQPATLPDDVAAAAYEASLMIVSSEDMRAGRFGPPVAARPDCSETERLVAFLGRRP